MEFKSVNDVLSLMNPSLLFANSARSMVQKMILHVNGSVNELAELPSFVLHGEAIIYADIVRPFILLDLLLT
jgi:hypothetical protein